MAERTAPADDQSGDSRSVVRPRLRTQSRAKGEGRLVALEHHGVRRAQRRARDQPRGRLMPDPRKVRADANALVTELLERLAHAEVSELEVKRGGVRVRVARDGARVATSASGTTEAPNAAPAAPAAPAKELPTVNAPLTGIFYRATSPPEGAVVQARTTVASRPAHR